MIISRTPFRISFFGGGTDYPAWFRENNGAVLSTTIDKYCYIFCRFLPPFFEHKTRIVYSKIELVKNYDEIRHPAVREILKHMKIEEGVDIHHDGDLPARAGLGSSSSFTVGLLHALYALRRSMPSKRELALEAIRIERDILKECGGIQDQVAAAFGGFNKTVFSCENEFLLSPVIMERERLNEFQSHLLLFFTGFSRFSSEIAEKKEANIPHRKAELTRMGEMVDEGLSILKGREDLARFGKLMDESWKLKKTLASTVSNGQLDSLYREAMDAGALGGKLLGAGGGGFLLIFARPSDHAKIKEKLKGLFAVPFQFENNGSQIIFYEPSTRSRDGDSLKLPERVLSPSAGNFFPEAFTSKPFDAR